MTTTRHDELRAPGATRTRLWDRVKILLGLAALHLLLTWKVTAEYAGVMPFADGARTVSGEHPWIFWLMGAEAARQAHLLMSERWAAYRRFWGGVSGRADPRLARVMKIALLVGLLAVMLGTSPPQALFHVPAMLFGPLPFAVQAVLVSLLAIALAAGLVLILSRGGVRTCLPGDIRVRFADVWGQDRAVERARESALFLARPGAIEERGGYAPGTLLLWGPPGTGKKLIAEAVAGETGTPYVVVEAGALTGGPAEAGGLKVRALFWRLRRLARRYGGVVVLFDGLDALGPARRDADFSGCHGLGHLSQESRALLASQDGSLTGGGRALVSELAALRGPRRPTVVGRLLGMRSAPPYRVLVVLTAGRPDGLDDELLRRVDRVCEVGHPSWAGRVRTYRGYLGKVAHTLTADQVDRLATLTPGVTGAAIEDLVNESLLAALRDGREGVTWADVLHALRVRRLGTPADQVERERHAAAVHEACHAVVAYVTRRHLETDVVTIEKVAVAGTGGRAMRWRSEYEADVMVSLASLAGERMFFDDDSSSDVSGDLHAATFLSALMESSWGMGTNVSSLPALRDLKIGEPPLAERIEDRLVRLLERTGELLREHRREVLCLAHALETHRAVSAADVVAIFQRRRGPLVDGAAYASDDLFQELEEYHAEAVSAHRERRRLARQLPYVPGKRPPTPVNATTTFHGEVPPGTAPGGGFAGRSQLAIPGVGAAVSSGGRSDRTAEFLPWAGGSHDTESAGRGRVWVVAGSVFTLVGVAIIFALALTGVLATTPAAGSESGVAAVPDPLAAASPWLLITLFVVVVAVVAGVGLTSAAVKAMRTAQAKAERDRDEAHARAQFLAAALDPDTAMRLLGYDGNRRHGTA